MYVNHLVNRFQETGENNLNLAVLQQVVINTAHEVIGKEESVLRNGWFDEECTEATENKNKAYNKTVQRCETRGAEERNKEMRNVKTRINRKKKKEYYDEQMKQVQKQLGQKERRMYRLVNDITKGI